jgi:hypothetical protein
MTTPAAPSPVAPPLPEPLRLPRGSVHGLLAIFLLGTFGYLEARSLIAPTVLVNAVVVCVAFYFGSHTAAPTTASGATGPMGSGRRPWIVRGLLILGFAGLAGWFVYEGRPWDQLPTELVEIWQVLGGYLLGLTLSWVFHHRARETPLRRRIALVFRDLSAAGALAFTLFACYALATGVVSTFGQTVEQGLSLVITYYFGSRVIAH